MNNFKYSSFLCLLTSISIGTVPAFADRNDEGKNRQDRRSERTEQHGNEKPKQNQAQVMPQRHDSNERERQIRQPQITQQRQDQGNRSRQERSPGNIQQRRGKGPSGQDRSALIQKRQEFGQRIRSDQKRSEQMGINRFPQQDRETLRRQAEVFRKERSGKERSADFNKRAKEIKESYSKRSGNDRKESEKISMYAQKRYLAYKNWFTPSFYRNRHHLHGHYWRNDVNWWRGAPWNRVYTWLGWGAAGGLLYPIYYDNGYPVQFDSGWTDYYNNPSYPEETQGSWLPLGVFALSPNVAQPENPDMFMQLAVNRDGEISGTFYNAATDRSFPLVGYVDKDTQEAYWQVTGENFAPEMAAGLFNLTQDVADVELTFTNREIQNWTLIRVSQ